MEVKQFPGGRPYLRLRCEGTLTLADSEQLYAAMGPGGPHHRMRVLAFASSDTDYSPEARRHLPALNRQYLALAVVVRSAIARAAINLMMRFVGEVGQMRLFRGEDEALAWLATTE